MRVHLEATCPRCGAQTVCINTTEETALIAAQTHVCADGVRTPSGPLVERRVPGPGERTKLPEERS